MFSLALATRHIVIVFVWWAQAESSVWENCKQIILRPRNAWLPEGKNFRLCACALMTPIAADSMRIFQSRCGFKALLGVPWFSLGGWGPHFKKTSSKMGREESRLLTLRNASSILGQVAFPWGNLVTTLNLPKLNVHFPQLFGADNFLMPSLHLKRNLISWKLVCAKVTWLPRSDIDGNYAQTILEAQFITRPSFDRRRLVRGW